MFKFIDGDWDKLEKYLVVRGILQYNDRIIEIMFNNVDVLLCLDERNRKVIFLVVDGEVVGGNECNTFITKRCLEKFIEDSRTAIYTKQEIKGYKYYLNTIRMNTEPPVEDESMFIVQAIDWLEIEAELLKH